MKHKGMGGVGDKERVCKTLLIMSSCCGIKSLQKIQQLKDFMSYNGMLTKDYDFIVVFLSERFKFCLDVLQHIKVFCLFLLFYSACCIIIH